MKLSTTQIDGLHEEATRRVLTHTQDSLLAFTKFTMPDYVANWHHRVLCRYLDAFARKQIKRLMVFMPPRHGKSELVSRRLPAFIFGRNRDTSIIGTSYGADLSSRINRDIQRVMESERYKMVFPESSLNSKNTRQVSGSWLRNSDVFEIVGARGIYRSAGVGGGITGMGGEYVIIDDPIKNQEEASSEVYRQKVWDWYASTLYTRLEKEGCLLLTMTRWHEDDLAGRILELEGKDWVVISFPAVREDTDCADDPRELDTPLWPWKYSQQDLNRIKVSVGSRVWNALYQQRPSPEEGDIVKRSWWKFYDCLPANLDLWAQSWDLTFDTGKNNDFVAGQVYARQGANRYLVDQVRDRLGFNDQLRVFQTLSAKYPQCGAKWVEKAANGAALIATLQSVIPGIIPVRPLGSKENRARAVAPQIEAGNVWLPDPVKNPWVHDFIEEWAGFPNGKHDDQVDAMSQALNQMTQTSYEFMPISISGPSKWR